MQCRTESGTRARQTRIKQTMPRECCTPGGLEQPKVANARVRDQVRPPEARELRGGKRSRPSVGLFAPTITQVYPHPFSQTPEIRGARNAVKLQKRSLTRPPLIIRAQPLRREHSHGRAVSAQRPEPACRLLRGASGENLPFRTSIRQQRYQRSHAPGNGHLERNRGSMEPVPGAPSEQRTTAPPPARCGCERPATKISDFCHRSLSPRCFYVCFASPATPLSGPLSNLPCLVSLIAFHPSLPVSDPHSGLLQPPA